MKRTNERKREAEEKILLRCQLIFTRDERKPSTSLGKSSARTTAIRTRQAPIGFCKFFHKKARYIQTLAERLGYLQILKLFYACDMSGKNRQGGIIEISDKKLSASLVKSKVIVGRGFVLRFVCSCMLININLFYHKFIVIPAIPMPETFIYSICTLKKCLQLK